MGWIIFGVVVVAIILWFVGVYNKLISLKQRVENAWAQIDTQLVRRFDLIPNLVETVKGYAKHESDTLEKVIAARTQYMSANGDVAKMAEAENVLSGTLKSIFALSEAYPELKANVNFQQMQTELTGTEDKIAYARQFYNDTVQMFNTEILKFPNNIVVSICGAGNFTKQSFFEAAAEEKKNVRVQF
ncbi:MAG: LemA family protein [Clostridia bacterium]|nr:LemA family protein [Clostridia bacterium]